MEKAECECTDDKEPFDLKSISKQQQGKYAELNAIDQEEINGAKYLQSIIVISIKATVLEFVLERSQTKELIFSLFVY